MIHSFAVPAFWTKMDANPGRVNETWVKVDRPGVYFGQCCELCGARHGYMPIAVEVVSRSAVQRLARLQGRHAQGRKRRRRAHPAASEIAPAAAAAPAAPAPAAIEQPVVNQPATAQN